MARQVKTINAALGRTNRPLPVSTPVTTGDNLQNLAAGLGTCRDKNTYSTYTFPRPVTRDIAENMFRTSHTAKTVITAVPDDALREWRKFSFEEQGDSNTQNDLLEQAEIDFKIKVKFTEAWYWARMYGGAMIIIGLSDVMSSADMMKPLDVTKVKKGDLKYLHVVDRWRCAPSGKITYDVLSPNFGLPESYLFAESALEIHHTRILRFNGQKLPYFAWQANGMWDDSELQHVYNPIINYDQAMQSVSSMLWEANIDVVHVKNLTNLLATKEGEAKVRRRFELGQMMKSFNRTLIMDGDETYDKKTNQFTNLDKIIQEYRTDIQGATHIAMSRLFGEQPGGLGDSNDGDLLNYYDFCAKERFMKVDPQLCYFDQIFVRSVLGQMPKGYKSEWNSLWQMDDTDKSAMQYQDAQRDQIYLQSSVVHEGLVAADLKRRGVYPLMTTEDVQLAQELGENMDEHEDVMREQKENPPDNTPSSGAAPNTKKSSKDAKSSDAGRNGNNGAS